MFTTEMLNIIEQILKHGNSAEIKKCNGKIEIIEIKRQLKIKH